MRFFALFLPLLKKSLRKRLKFHMKVFEWEKDSWGCTSPFTNFLYFWLRSSKYKKDFLLVLSKPSLASMAKNFHFSDEWKVDIRSFLRLYDVINVGFYVNLQFLASQVS